MLFGTSAGSFAEPLASRSARSCKIRMAFGWTILAPAPPTGVVGGLTSRANPNCNHSVVMPVHTPAAFLYSTRNQPSLRFQGLPPAQGDPIGAPIPFQFPSVAAAAIALVGAPAPPPPSPFTAIPVPSAPPP